MATLQKPHQKPQVYGVYMKSMLTKRITLSINQVGKNIKRMQTASAIVARPIPIFRSCAMYITK